MKDKPSGDYTIEYRTHDSLSQDDRYIEALTELFNAAEQTVLVRQESTPTHSS